MIPNSCNVLNHVINSGLWKASSSLYVYITDVYDFTSPVLSTESALQLIFGT